MAISWRLALGLIITGVFCIGIGWVISEMADHSWGVFLNGILNGWAGFAQVFATTGLICILVGIGDVIFLLFDWRPKNRRRAQS